MSIETAEGIWFKFVEWSIPISSIPTTGTWVEFENVGSVTWLNPGSLYRIMIRGPSSSGIRWGFSDGNLYTKGSSSRGACCDFQFRTYAMDHACNLIAYGDLTFPNMVPGSTTFTTIHIENDGLDGSKLDWEIDSYPNWGTWVFDPQQGLSLKPSQGPKPITVTLTVPTAANQQYTGTVKIINTDNPSDYQNIPVTLSTPKNKLFMNPFITILQNYPNLFSIIQRILLLQ